MQINQTKPKGATPDHLNYMGGHAWDVNDPISNLRLAAASCFFGEPQYYVEASSTKRARPAISGHTYGYGRYSEPPHRSYLDAMLESIDPTEWRGLGAKERMESAIDSALVFDVEKTLQVAADLRNLDNIRTTPQVILVRAANFKGAKGTGLVVKYAPQIIRRADEPSVQMAYQLATYGKPIPNQLKKAWANYLSRQTAYSLAKYRMESRTVKTVDVANISHPGSPVVNDLVRGTLTTPETWETKVSAGGSWDDAFESMGHMALLRNLRNLIQKSDVDQGEIAVKLLLGAPDGKQLPFRYWSAYQSIKDHGVKPVLLEAVEDSLRQSCSRLAFPGRVMSLCDNSGSAWGTVTSEWGSVHVAEIANLTAVLTAFASEHGEVGVFGDRLETFTVSHRSSVFDALEKANKLGRGNPRFDDGVGGATENGIWLFWDDAIRNKTVYDAVFVYSDMQAGHGGLYGDNPVAYRDYVWPSSPRHIDVPKLINKYHSTVNPNVQVFLVQVAGYQDTIVPDHYRNTHILGGWSDGILRYAQEFLNPPQQQI